MRILYAAVALAGCSYQPGSFAGAAFASTTGDMARTTAGCFDIAVERARDHEASAVIHYAFGNRCRERRAVDLGRVAVRGRTLDGEELVLAPYDPQGQIRPIELDARTRGRETLGYPSALPLAQVCVDLASLAPDARPHWRCFASPPEPEPEPEPEPDTDIPAEVAS